MKYIFYTFLSLIILASCKTNKDYLSRSDNDNTLFDAIKTLKNTIQIQQLYRHYRFYITWHNKETFVK
ncbi:MAG: hypothetical protein IPI88_14470 [Chitinophagaceae bacterium]|nr:hypothetical protein [Chitinophagaceae bacterium]